jgi:hypothetical protein
MPDAIAVPSLQTTADVVEQRLYDLERRRKTTPPDANVEDCCVTYCKFANTNITSFNTNTTALSLSVPILNPGRLRVAATVSATFNGTGDFWLQINPQFDATNFQVQSEHRVQSSANGDKGTASFDEAFDYAAGTTGFITVSVFIFNLSVASIDILGSLTVDVKGRHGSLHCSPAQIGQ